VIKYHKETKKDFCWLLLKASLGEFHAIVPELVHFAQQENLQLTISFISDKIENKFFDNPLYRELTEHYFQVVKREDILDFAKKNKKKIKYLFRDLSPINQYSVARSLKIILPDTKLIIFPHAFAIHVSKSLSNYQTVKIPSKNKFEDCVDAFIIFTEDDKNYYSERFPSEIITVFTPRGLSEEWLSKLQNLIPSNEIKAFQKKYPKRILLTLRHPHKIYLSEKIYFELLEEVREVANNFGFELFLKPHPRQDLKELSRYCETNELQMWMRDTYTSALFFDHVITFWSSASIDFAAFAIPTVEHFRFHKYHNQLIEKDGKLSSLYVNMGLSLSSSNKAELEVAFKKITENPTKVGNEQQKKLEELYSSSRLELNHIGFHNSLKNSAHSVLDEVLKITHNH